MAIRRIADLPDYTSLSSEYLDPQLSSCLFEASFLDSEREYRSVHIPATAIVGKAFDTIQETPLTSFSIDGGRLTLTDTDFIGSGENFSVTYNSVGIRSNGDATFEAVRNVTLSAGQRMSVWGNPVVINGNLAVYTDHSETGNRLTINGQAYLGNTRNCILARTLRTSDIKLSECANDAVTCELLNKLVYGYWKANTRNFSMQIVAILDEGPNIGYHLSTYYRTDGDETWRCACSVGNCGYISNVNVSFPYGSTVYAYAVAPAGYKVDSPNNIYTRENPAVFQMTEDRRFAGMMSRIT